MKFLNFFAIVSTLSRQNKAFSLIEMSIVMAVMAILASSVAPIAIRSAQVKAGEKTALEMSMIQEASRNYFITQHSWPEDISILQTQGYLNPIWAAENPWHHPYQIFSTPFQLTVVTIVPIPWANLIASHLPAAIVNEGSISSTISSFSDSGVDSGIIVAWSGAIESIPSGWLLCDGNNGTPDLRDKFVVGAREDVLGVAKSNVMGSMLQAGGLATHNHGGETGSHALTISEMPRHHHGYMATPWTGSRYDGHSSPLMTEQRSGQTDDTGGDQGHSHPVATDFNVPPFYALAFIMKV